MRIEKRRIENLIPADYNPRKELQPGDPEFEKLKRSIQEFGLVEPIILNVRTGRVVGGHQRLNVLKSIGETETDVVIVDLEEEKEKALNIALNKVTGEWDQDKLKALLFDLSEVPDFDATMTGFDQEEIDQITDLSKVMLGEAEEDGYEEPGEMPAKTKPGDVWILGDHRLICGDATDPAVVKKLVGGVQLDLLLTDPPYNVAYQQGTGNVKRRKDGAIISNDRLPDDEFETLLAQSFQNAADNMRPGASFYVWHASKSIVEFSNALLRAGFDVKSTLIWVKSSFVLGRQDYQWRHEPCLYGWKEGAAHYFTNERNLSTVIEDTVDFSKMKKAEMQEMLEKIFSDDFPTTILHEDRPNRSDEHPTMKPVRLIARLVHNSTKPGEKVLDLFGGSGSTMIAAEQLKRACYMAELEPHYCDVIVDRWEKYTGRKAVLDV